MSLSLDSQIYAFAEIGKLEQRVLAIENLVATLKRKCLVTKSGTLPEMVGATAELRWQLGQIATLILGVEGHLGIKGRGSPGLPTETQSDAKLPESLRGTTDSLAIPDLVNLLSSQKKTGSLTIRTGAAIYMLEFLEGAIVHAVTNETRPEWRLGTILEAQGKLTQEQLAESLAAIERTRELLGAELVRTARVSETDLRAALEIQVRKMFESIFALQKARFTFMEGTITNIGQRVYLNTTELLLETARRIDESVGKPQDAGDAPLVQGGVANLFPPRA